MRRYSAASFADIEAALIELRSSVDFGDAQAAREALHKIDGTAANLGAGAIIQANSRVKSCLSDLCGPAASTALAEIATVCALTKSAMSAALEQCSLNRDPGQHPSTPSGAEPGQRG